MKEAPGLHFQMSSYLEPQLPNAPGFYKAGCFETKLCNVPWASLNRKMPLALLLSREKVDTAQQRLQTKRRFDSQPMVHSTWLQGERKVMSPHSLKTPVLAKVCVYRMSWKSKIMWKNGQKIVTLTVSIMYALVMKLPRTDLWSS